MMILFLLYTTILEALYFLLSPVLFTIFRVKPGSERLAINYPVKHYRILVHAASVGEINGIKQLLTELLSTNPELNILLTTNTKTGRKIAQKLHPRLDVILSPLDIYHLRRKQLSHSNPELILIVETEIWPTLLFAAKQDDIPIIFVNARISPKTLKQYLYFKSMLSWLGKSIKAICTQTEADRERFAQIFDTDCIRTGNLKFSVVQPEFDQAFLRKEWGYNSEDKIIVLGSSRPGEETLLLRCYDQLKIESPELKLIIAPRHLERMSEINTILGVRDVSYFSRQEPAKSIHIIDEMGNLLPAYALCDIAIIGGSFYPFGGHNPLEAAFYSKIIIMGPHYDSCKGTVRKLQKADAIVFSSADMLTQDLHSIMKEPELFTDKGLRARQALEDNKDSLAKHLQIINQYLDKS